MADTDASRPTSRNGGRPPTLPPGQGSNAPSRSPTPPPGNGGSSFIPQRLRSLSPASWSLPKLGGGPKRPPSEPTPRRPSPRRGFKNAGGGDADKPLQTPRIKGAEPNGETPKGPPRSPLKEANRDLTAQPPPSARSHQGEGQESKVPAAVRAPSPRQAPPSSAKGEGDASATANAAAANAGHREMLEVQILAKQMLTEVYRQEVAEESVFTTLQAYPEVAWLAHCAARCPQPPCWGRYDDAKGSGTGACYINSQTGEASPHPPLLRHFAHLAGLALQARQEGRLVRADLQRALEQVRADTQLAKTAWDGPHLDTDSGVQYWYSPELGCSTWGDPAAAADFLARVISELTSLMPKEEEGESDGGREPLTDIVAEMRSGRNRAGSRPPPSVTPPVEPDRPVDRPAAPLREPTPPARRRGPAPSPRIANHRAVSVEPLLEFEKLARAVGERVFGSLPAPVPLPSERKALEAAAAAAPGEVGASSSSSSSGGAENHQPQILVLEDAPAGSPLRPPAATESRPKRPNVSRRLRIADDPERVDDAVAAARPRAPKTPRGSRGKKKLCDVEEQEHPDLNTGTDTENVAPASPSIFDVPPSPSILDVVPKEPGSPPSPSIIIVDERPMRTPPKSARGRPRSSRGRQRARHGRSE